MGDIWWDPDQLRLNDDKSAVGWLCLSLREDVDAWSESKHFSVLSSFPKIIHRSGLELHWFWPIWVVGKPTEVSFGPIGSFRLWLAIRRWRQMKAIRCLRD